MPESTNRLKAELEEQLRQYQIAHDWGDITETELNNATRKIRQEIELLTDKQKAA